MLQYRIYCLDDEGRFRKVEEVEASGDADALERARALGHSGECEVWRGSRLVGRIEPQTGERRQAAD
jgi:hypothetical protein